MRLPGVPTTKVQLRMSAGATEAFAATAKKPPAGALTIPVEEQKKFSAETTRNRTVRVKKT